MRLSGAPSLTLLTGYYTAMLYITTVFMARVMDPASYGIYSVVFAITAIVGSFATPGMEQLLARDVSVYHAHQKYGYLRGLVRSTNKTVLLWGGLLSIGTALVGFAIYSDDEAIPLCIGAPLILLTALGRLRASTIAGLGKTVTSRIPELALRPLLLAVTVATVYGLAGELTTIAAVGAAVLAAFVSFVIGTCILRTIMQRDVPRTTAQLDTKRWRAAAGPFFVFSVTTTVSTQIGTVLTQAFSNSHDAGLFAVANRGAGLVSLGFVGVAAAAGPPIAKYWAQGNQTAAAKLIWRMFAFSSVVGGLGTLLLYFFAADLLEVFGPEYVAATTALRIMCVGQLAFAVLGIFATTLLMTGNQTKAAVIMTSVVALSVALFAALVPIWGINGAALATSATFVLAYGLMAVVLARAWHRMWSSEADANTAEVLAEAARIDASSQPKN